MRVSQSLLSLSRTYDAQDIRLPDKGRVPVAFAVWDGANGERDGQKSVSTWYYLTIQ
jgi:DMSO reductase family type II enzyme heme b subunit